jgi:hypothetical protein
MNAKRPALIIPDINEICPRQLRWALNHGIKLDNDNRRFTQTVEENLFQPLTAATQADYALGRGDGLGSAIRRDRMRFLSSSSALICNVFDYWRSQLLLGRPLDSLTTALGAPNPVKLMQFRQSYRTSLRGSTPFINVVLRGDEPRPLLITSHSMGFSDRRLTGSTSIKSTFTELPDPIKSYYANSGELWGKYGLPRCEALARRISAGQEHFVWLADTWLLNNILGLVDKFGKDFTFLYLWYDYTFCGQAILRTEVETFILRLNGEIDFRAMTYQELFQKMQGDPAVDEKYMAYLRERYFA